MDAPKLTTRLTLEARVRSPDGAGGYNDIWSPLGTLWGAFQRPRGAAMAGAEVALARSRYRVIVRAAPVGSDARPEASQRFVADGRVYDIIAVLDHDAGKRFLACDVEEEVAG